jgi:hypothetical protein
MDSRTYVILTASQALNIDFDDVIEDSARTLRWNKDNSKTFVKYEGARPSWLEGKTTYTKAETLEVLNDPANGWQPDEEV